VGILTNRDLEKLRRVSWGDFLATTLPALYRVDGGAKELERALDGGACTLQQIPAILKQWRTPNHAEFAQDHSAWRLFNAFTEVAKEGSLWVLPKRTTNLHGLLDAEVGLLTTGEKITEGTEDARRQNVDAGGRHEADGRHRALAGEDDLGLRCLVAHTAPTSGCSRRMWIILSKRSTDDLLRFFDDALQMLGALETLGVKLVDVLRADPYCYFAPAGIFAEHRGEKVVLVKKL
jgi:hypothetical protein